MRKGAAEDTGISVGAGAVRTDEHARPPAGGRASAPQRAFSPLREVRAHPLLAALLALKRSRGEPLRGGLPEIASYHELRPAPESAYVLSRRAANDLDLDALFRRIDGCTSSAGQQVLYDMLRSPLTDPAAVRERAALIEALGGDGEVRAAIARALSGLRSRGGYSLPYLLLGPLAQRPRWWPVFPLLTAAALAAVALAFVNSMALLGLLVIVLLNMSIQASYRPTLAHFVAPLSALGPLLFAGRTLGALPTPALARHTAELRERCARIGRLDRLARGFVRELAGNEILATLVGYANLLFLADLNSFVFGIARIRRHREDLVAVFETLGMLDALCAVSAFRASLPLACTPAFAPRGKHVSARGLYHPLLTDPVPNDLAVDGRNLLVTGSNMAGKTTFLRAAALGAVLAQSIATVAAASWSAPPLRVASLITRNDDLEQGKSYFLVEAEIIRELLAAADSAPQYLIVMDEIFRGTNTRERLAASTAALDYLGRGDAFCLVATHDLELAQLLARPWDLWHFRESFGGDDVAFRLHPGLSSAPNALRLLQRAGYPRELTDAAFRTFDTLGDFRRDAP